MSSIIGFFASIISIPMTYIYDVFKNYAVSIVLLTIVVKGLMIPLYVSQAKSQAKMSALSSQVKDIQTRYANDKAMMNEKLNQLYADAGVKPASGCLPLLIQFPVILGLYQLLRSPLDYITGDAAVIMMAAVHEPFLWISDLSQPDAWVLPILAAVTTYFSSAAAMTQSTGDPATEGTMKSMKYFMPLMILLLARSFPAGLSLYWIVSNIFQAVQTYFFNKKAKSDVKKENIEKKVQNEINKSKTK